LVALISLDPFLITIIAIAATTIATTIVFTLFKCFTRSMRSFSPKAHIAEVCGNDKAWLNRCCNGGDGGGDAAGGNDNNNTHGSKLARVVGEWTAAYDQVVGGGRGQLDW
jgi:hypothetical protein